ncbi:stage II sporulation protein R [Lachnospiraceae bacterium 46-61]
MGEDKTANKKRKHIMSKAQMKVIISWEYVGTQTVTETFIPIIFEDIRREIAKYIATIYKTRK